MSKANSTLYGRVRSESVVLAHRQAVALAGEVYRDWSILEDDSGSPELWGRVRSENADAHTTRPYRHPLTIGTLMVDPLEERFGPLVDVVLKRRHLSLDVGSRQKTLKEIAKAFDQIAALLGRRAEGDYRPDTERDRFPDFVAGLQLKEDEPGTVGGLTFSDIISAEEKHRLHGLGAKYRPLSEDTVRKYTTITREFARFRGHHGDQVDTLTGDELEAWKADLLSAKDEAKANGARTVHYKVGAIKTVLGWGAARFPKNRNLLVSRDSVASVELPGFEKKASEISAIRLDEAVQVLRAARKETDPRTRWLPWLCAYSGARINELTPLERGDFRQVAGHWFFKIYSNGRRSVKNAKSEPHRDCRRL